jgi:hypothetical protein
MFFFTSDRFIIRCHSCFQVSCLILSRLCNIIKFEYRGVTFYALVSNSRPSAVDLRVNNLSLAAYTEYSTSTMLCIIFILLLYAFNAFLNIFCLFRPAYGSPSFHTKTTAKTETCNIYGITTMCSVHYRKYYTGANFCGTLFSRILRMSQDSLRYNCEYSVRYIVSLSKIY